MPVVIVSLAWRDLRSSGGSLMVFCACLALGVALISASGGLFRLVSSGLVADTRALFGGDLEIEHRVPLSAEELAWMRARGEVSRLVELRTMMRTGGRAHLVELQSFDDRYPLYGVVVLSPRGSLADALAQRDGAWGTAIDPTLARRLDLAPGDRVQLGDLTLTVRALIERQPDRSLRADWRGPPVLIAGEALAATGLVQPQSRVSYRYRVKTSEDPAAWRTAFAAAFPDADWEARTFAERSERLAEVLGQIVSGLLLIGFSALFIGGLGVFNSVQAYLQGKLATIATLRALGLRDRRLAGVYLAQVLMLGGASSLAGAAVGGTLALVVASVAAQSLPVAPTLALLPVPLAIAWVFGVLTALTFALPALGRALSISPAALFRGVDAAMTRTPPVYWKLTAVSGALTMLLALAVMPDPRFGFAFVLVTLLLLALLECMVRVLRTTAHRLAAHPLVADRFAMRLALANLYQPGSPLRATLLSLGSALTLLVASTLVVAVLLRTVNETIPERAPALVFYDIFAPQLEEFRALVQTPSLERLDLAPLVLGRLSAVNSEALRASGDATRMLEARDEHKLSYRLNNFDNVVIDRGAWWPQGYQGPPLVAMEDREADQLGLKVGDRLHFDIMGTPVGADLVAIYSQRRFEARFWLEAIFSDGTLDPHITRYVGAAYMSHRESVAVQDRIAAVMPQVVTVRTENILNEARTLLGRAAAGLAVIASVSLVASLLVLVSVVASSRVRKVYDASILHTLGARVAVIRRSLQLEYLLLAVLTSVFAIGLGSAIAAALLQYRLGLEIQDMWWAGVLTAPVVSVTSLWLGARYLLRQLRMSPAFLLRTTG
jgi:putative ABC transport system permease protein